MNDRKLALPALVLALACGAAQADPLALKPGLYETRVEGGKGAKPDIDKLCIDPDEAKDVEAFFRKQGETHSCKPGKVAIQGKHYSGTSVCQGGADLKSADVQVSTELDFTDSGYRGTVHRRSDNHEGKPLNETLKISAKRIGDCKE